MTRTLNYVAAWIALALMFGAIVGSLNVRKLWNLTSRGVGTRGTVLALEPMNHRSIHYSYRIGRDTYTGIGSDGYGNPDFSVLSTGDPVLVFFDAASPASSVLGDPHQRLSNELTSVALVMLTAPTFMLFVFIMKKRRSSRYGIRREDEENG